MLPYPPLMLCCAIIGGIEIARYKGNGDGSLTVQISWSGRTGFHAFSVRSRPPVPTNIISIGIPCVLLDTEGAPSAMVCRSSSSYRLPMGLRRS